MVAIPIWRVLLMQEIRIARSFALLKAGNNIAAKIAMMAMTTNSSIKVKADARRDGAGSGEFMVIELSYCRLNSPV